MNLFPFSLRVVLLIIFIIPMSLPAQSTTVKISGKVRDVVTEGDLPDVKIYLTNLMSGSADSTVTDASGYWEYEVSVTSVDETPNLIKQFMVYQNYPNPFNPSTLINFFLPQAGRVSVTVYNTLGVLLDSREQYLPEGQHSIEWSGSGSAGVYFFNVKTKNGSVTKKMTQLDNGYGHGLSSFISVHHVNPSLLKNTLSVPMRITASKFAYISHTIEAEIEGGEYFAFSLETIHSHSVLVDLHNDILEKMIIDPYYHLKDFHTYNHTDIPRMKSGGVDVQFFAVWVSPYSHGHDSYQHAQAMIDVFNTELALNSTDIDQAFTAQEALTIVSQKKIAAVLGVEGGHAIENSIDKLITLYEAGMRYLTITWNNSTDWAVSAKDVRSGTVGLSDFGKQVIRTLDSLGVIVDVSHTGIKTMEDILQITGNPIIATHSGVRALRNHYRNLYDDQIIAIANTGGVVGVVFYPPYLTYTGIADIDKVVDHIDYIVNLVGIDYAALGSDFDGIGNNTVYGLENVSKFPDLTRELLHRGYSQTDIEKILGKNFMRVFETVCGE